MIKKISYWISVGLTGSASIYLFLWSRETLSQHYLVDYSQNSMPLDHFSEWLLRPAFIAFALYTILLLLKGKILKD